MLQGSLYLPASRATRYTCRVPPCLPPYSSPLTHPMLCQLRCCFLEQTLLFPLSEMFFPQSPPATWGKNLQLFPTSLTAGFLSGALTEHQAPGQASGPTHVHGWHRGLRVCVLLQCAVPRPKRVRVAVSSACKVSDPL